MGQVQRLVTPIAASQLAIITSANLKKVGVDTDSAYRRVKSGEWERCSFGVYRVVASGREPTIEQRMLAANLGLPNSVIVGWFAARIHGLPVLADLDALAVTLAVPRGRRSRCLTARRCRGPIPSQPWQFAGRSSGARRDGANPKGLPQFIGRVASPALTIITIAASGASKHRIETVLDAALTRRIVTVDRIAKLLMEVGWLKFQGRGRLTSLLQERNGGRALFRSQTEAKVKRWLRSDGVSNGKPNYNVSTGIGDVEVDIAWPSIKVCLEISPFWTHGSRRTQQRDTDRRQALTAAGWRVVEADDRHLDNVRSFGPIIGLLRQCGVS